MKKKEKFKEIIDALIKKHNIKIKKYRSSNSGCAYQKSREIEIPVVKSIGSFCTAIHEIGHIVDDKQSHPVWKSEYIACKFEEKICNEHKILIPSKVMERNRNYVMMSICKGLRRRLDIDNIDVEVLDYARINYSEWRQKLRDGFKPFVRSKKGAWEEIEVSWDRGSDNNVYEENC